MSNAKAEARKAARVALYGLMRGLEDVDAAIDAYEAALESAGLVLVPREPTEAMLRAAYLGENVTNPDALRWTAQSYRAMIAAAEPK